MNTHISWIKQSLVGAIFGLVLLSLSTFATDFNFALPASLGGGSFPISFGGGGNEFPGVLIISSQTLVNKRITFDNGGNSITCKRQIHGYYFNVARGIGLLPLSELSSATIPGVTVNGGLYTACGAGGVYLYDLIGAVKYTYNGSPQDGMGGIYFGVNINDKNNTTNGSHQPGAIAWKVTNGINGMFFDSMFGVGTIRTLPNDGGIGSVGNLIGVFSNIYIQGQTSIGQSVEKNEREILSVNLAGTRTVLNNNQEANASKVINSANKNVARNCPKYMTISKFYQLNKKNIPSTICIDAEGSTFVIEEDNYELVSNKDIIIKGGNVFLDDTIYNIKNKLDNAGPLSIYIPEGNLIFDSNIISDDLSDIDKNGFRSANGQTGATKGVYLEGNFIINGLILGSPNKNLSPITTIPFKTYIHGKLATLNTLTSVSQQRVNHLSNLLNTRDLNYAELSISGGNTYFSNNTWNASLGDVFSWRCNDTTGMGAIPIGEFDDNTIEAVTESNCAVGHRYPLVITDKNIYSNLFNQ